MEEINFLRLALKGTPRRVAPFRVIPYFVLLKPSGGRDRMVELINIRGESSGLVPLDENSFTAPRDWRRWLARVGNFSWESGEGALEALQRDINFRLARREVTQLACYGCERPGTLWVLDDCAFADDGTIVIPDKNGIYRHNGRAYTFLRDKENHPIGDEGQSFRFKDLPRMRPSMGLVFDEKGQLQLQDGAKDDLDAVRDLLGSFLIHLKDSYDGYEGVMLIAGTVAFFAGPGLYRKCNAFPGIFISGEKGSGKTFTAKLLMALHGFTEIEAGLSFKTSSAVGTLIGSGQCANIPIWGDEYKETELKNPDTRGVIHSGFNRDTPSKWSKDGKTWAIRTAFLITGETTSGNAATMSRFVTAVASRGKWKGTEEEKLARFNWLQDNRRFLFAIGRVVLQHWGNFAARVSELLSEWERLPELAQCDPRARFTYGVSYAAFRALNEIIPIYDEKECRNFRDWMIEKTAASSHEVEERVTINQFWTMFVSALANKAFGNTPAELSKLMKLVKNHKATPPLGERQLKDGAANPRLAWSSYLLYFRPVPVLDLMRKYAHSQGLELPLDRVDLLAQMKDKPYFVPGPRQGHQQKFGKGCKVNLSCWCIDLDKFEELGRRIISDEEWVNSFHRDGNPENEGLPIEEWVDPRKGDLFILEDLLKEKERDGHA
jgi:hypothetical protein